MWWQYARDIINYMTTKVPIIAKFTELKNTIKKYESDTFSASAEKITDLEAIEITDRMIIKDIQSRIDLDNMDGIEIAEALEDLRDK